MRPGRLPAILLLAATITVATVASYTLTQRKIPSMGRVFIVSLGVDVFWDLECSSQVSEVDWGTLGPGDSRNVSVYVKNTGNKALILSFNTTEWAPAIVEAYIAVTWDAEDALLSLGYVLPADIILSVSTGISGISDFQFSIFIIGGEA